MLARWDSNLFPDPIHLSRLFVELEVPTIVGPHLLISFYWLMSCEVEAGQKLKLQPMGCWVLPWLARLVKSVTLVITAVVKHVKQSLRRSLWRLAEASLLAVHHFLVEWVESMYLRRGLIWARLLKQCCYLMKALNSGSRWGVKLKVRWWWSPAYNTAWRVTWETPVWQTISKVIWSAS